MEYITFSELPGAPTFNDEQIKTCNENGDYRPILFEFYKYIGILSNKAACIERASPAIPEIASVHFAVLIGLLNRCSRLMLSNIALSSTGRFGETTRLIDRCIAESAIKIQWLCHKNNDDSFRRYLADGLKNDVKLRLHIQKNIADRNGEVFAIESRMLDSIQRKFVLADLTDQDVDEVKRLPDLSSMCRVLQFSELTYTALQRMGSHAVHGTWSELLCNYLREENGRLVPRDHEIETEDVQYIITSQLVMAAISEFLAYISSDPRDIEEFTSRLDEVSARLVDIQNAAWKSDFESK